MFNFRRRQKLVLLLLIQSFLLDLGSPTSTANSWRDEMLSNLNRLRVEKGVSILKLCPNLENSAQLYALMMSKGNFLSHTGKDGSTLETRTKKSGFVRESKATFFSLGENIAAGQPDVIAVMKGWRESPAHYANMLNSTFTHVGFGMSNNSSSKYGIYWVQNFGSGGKCR